MARGIDIPETKVIDDGLVMLADEEIMVDETDLKDDPAKSEQATEETAAPEPAPETPEAPAETAAKKDPTWLTDFPGAQITYNKPIMGKGEYRMPNAIVELYRGLGIGTLNQPLEVAYMRYHDEGYDIAGLEDRFSATAAMSWPIVDSHDRLARKGSMWTNDVVAEGLSTKATAVRPRGDEVVDIFTSQNTLGQTTEWTFYNTGIKIRVRPCLDSELVNLERMISTDRSIVGKQTYGTVLGTDMGVHLGYLIDFALGLVTWTNLEHTGDMRVALRQHLRGRESINVLLCAVLASMYPRGYPWQVHCHAGDCTATHDIDVFFARAQVTDLSVLTEKHLNILHRNSKQLTEDTYLEYLEALEFTTRDFEYNGTVYTLRVPSIADYAAAARRWINVIEVENATALEEFDNPVQRENFLDAQQASRMLVSISHYIGKITLDNAGTITEVTDRDKIESILHAASGDMQLTIEMMAAVTKFEVESTNTFIGHSNMTCPTCGAAVRTQEGPWSSLVLLPVDRIFFMLTQLKTQILHGLRNRH